MLAGRQRHALRADIAEVRDPVGVTQTIVRGRRTLLWRFRRSLV
jgi:hypothetical protein